MDRAHGSARRSLAGVAVGTLVGVALLAVGWLALGTVLRGANQPAPVPTPPGFRATHLPPVDCSVNNTANPHLVASGQLTVASDTTFPPAEYVDPNHPSTFVGYAFPSAADLPSWEFVEMETPTPNNPLGAKGIGESGTMGSTPAVQSAVVDALSPFGVRHVEMPVHGENVWRALQAARA